MTDFDDISLEEWEIRTRHKADHLKGEKYDIEPAGELIRVEREIACPDCGSFRVGGINFGEQPVGLEQAQDNMMLEVHRKHDHVAPASRPRGPGGKA